MFSTLDKAIRVAQNMTRVSSVLQRRLTHYRKGHIQEIFGQIDEGDKSLCLT